MSQSFSEGQLTFDFPDAWLVCRPEESSFHVRHFSNFCRGCKEVDFLAYDPASLVMWLIEVKDYRVHPRTKESDIADEMAVKSRDVLAMLPVAGIRDNAASNPGKLQAGAFWKKARDARDIRVVLHCELPSRPSKLFPGVKDSANLQSKLIQKLRCIDPHPVFTNLGSKHSLPWTVA